MSEPISEILLKSKLEYEDIVSLLSVSTESDRTLILNRASEIRENTVGNNIYLRGLIELSNICRKNCYYCGIRAGNLNVERFTVNEDDVLDCARHAYEMNYGSVVIQSGERNSKEFTRTISTLVSEIKDLSNNQLGITLSCGEQSKDTYKEWFDNGAHRYLLRFESSDQDLYYRIHPEDSLHNFSKRLIALKDLRDVGYQVGSGMMIGLPGQTIRNLADDLMLLKSLDIDMVGMGPYIEHVDTPLYLYKGQLLNKKERLNLSILTIAVLRILMKDINIASGTALDSLDSKGREKAILAGANILMPNLTPANYREKYFLYQNKPYLTEADELVQGFDTSQNLNKFKICPNHWGDSIHFKRRSV